MCRKLKFVTIILYLFIFDIEIENMGIICPLLAIRRQFKEFDLEVLINLSFLIINLFFKSVFYK